MLFAATGFANLSEYELFRAAGFDGVLAWPLRLAAVRARFAAAGLLPEDRSGHMLTSRSEARALFWIGLAEDIERLKAAAASGRTTDISRWAHRIKGASLMFGETELGASAAALDISDSGLDTLGRNAIAERVRNLDELFHTGFTKAWPARL
ncbi:hypothetical protein BH09PSE5_BH09PSE5_16790 [soil metagenome]